MGRSTTRSRAATKAGRIAAGVTVIALAGCLAACSGGGSGSTAAGDAMSEAGDSSGAGALADSDGGAAARESAPEVPGVNRAVVQTRAFIKTGQVAVTDKDLDRTRDEVDQLLFGFGGSIDSEETSHDDDGKIERSTLALRVPVAKFEAAMKALEKLGKMETSDSRSKDVTTKVIDVNERVETLETSLDRLQAFQSKAENIDDLIRFEDQITTREAELQSLKAQQSYLDDQTAMSTITLYLSTPEKYVAPPDALEDAGFLAGLKSGWNALTDTVVVGLTVFGALLPFLVALALVGLPLWLLVRSIVRRRVDPAPPAEPEAG